MEKDFKSLSYEAKKLDLKSLITNDNQKSHKAWKLFSKAKNALIDGVRLENLSWRLFSKQKQSKDESLFQNEKPVDEVGEMENKKSCINCSTVNTVLWRKNSLGFSLCNACGLFLKLHGVNRPQHMKTDVIKKRIRKAKRDEEVSKPRKIDIRKNNHVHEQSIGINYWNSCPITSYTDTFSSPSPTSIYTNSLNHSYSSTLVPLSLIDTSSGLLNSFESRQLNVNPIKDYKNTYTDLDRRGYREDEIIIESSQDDSSLNVW